MTKLIVDGMIKDSVNIKEPEILTVITKPLSNSIVQLDRKVLEAIAKNETLKPDQTLIKHFCSSKVVEQEVNETLVNVTVKIKCKFKLCISIDCTE